MYKLKILVPLTIVTLFSQSLFGQLTTLFNIQNPWGITVDEDNILYVGSNSDNTVFRTDLNANQNSRDAYVDGINGASSLLVVDNILYIGERNGNRVSTYPTSDQAGSAMSCKGFEFPPVGLAQANNILYIAEREGNKITSLDLDEGCSSSFSTVVNNIDQAYGVTIVDDILYGSASVGGYIFSTDLVNSPDVQDTIMTGLSTPAGIHVIGSTLYVAEFGQNRIARIDNLGPDQTVSFIQVGAGPLGLAADNNGNLYVSEFTENRVSMFSILSNTVDYADALPIKIFPNPSQDVISLELSTNELLDYRILSIDGTIVQTGTIQPDQQINIVSLTSGHYTLILAQHQPQQFQKL